MIKIVENEFSINEEVYKIKSLVYKVQRFFDLHLKGRKNKKSLTDEKLNPANVCHF